MNTNIDWRITADEYVEMKNRIRNAHENDSIVVRYSMHTKSRMNDTISEWSNKEIICRIMMDSERAKSSDHINIVMPYVCETYTIPEEMLHDIIYVGSGLCCIGVWDDRVIDWVCHIWKNTVRPGIVGNALPYILKALESHHFKDMPEYEKFLESLVAEYSELCGKLLKLDSEFREKKPSIDNLVKHYISVYPIAMAINKYSVDVYDVVDWNAIDCGPSDISFKFMEEYARDRK